MAAAAAAAWRQCGMAAINVAMALKISSNTAKWRNVANNGENEQQ